LSSPDFTGVGTVIAGAAAVGTIIWGIIQYRKGLVIQRQQVLFDHISKLNCKELDDAKMLLAYGHVRKIKDGAKDGAKVEYYTIKNRELPFLYHPEEEPITDPRMLEIKESLDSFIVFLGKVGYSLEVGAIQRNEIVYFYYWIGRTLKYTEVQDYINNSQFPLYDVLLKELIKSRMDRFLGRLFKLNNYQNEWYKTLPTAKQKKKIECLQKKLERHKPYKKKDQT
jgi:hypothetical protein